MGHCRCRPGAPREMLVKLHMVQSGRRWLAGSSNRFPHVSWWIIRRRQRCCTAMFPQCSLTDLMDENRSRAVDCKPPELTQDGLVYRPYTKIQKCKFPNYTKCVPSVLLALTQHTTLTNPVGVMLGCCTAQRAVQWSLLTNVCMTGKNLTGHKARKQTNPE